MYNDNLEKFSDDLNLYLKRGDNLKYCILSILETSSLIIRNNFVKCFCISKENNFYQCSMSIYFLFLFIQNINHFEKEEITN